MTDTTQASGEAATDDGANKIGTFAPFDEFDPTLSNARAIGIDAGATLTKLCVRRSDDSLYFASFASRRNQTAATSDLAERVLALLEQFSPDRVGLTGCGAADLAPKLNRPMTTPIEFDAWGIGANEMLSRLGLAAESPYLLVAIGTGTSALHVDGDQVERLGGTALGGGAALGLGLALTGVRTPEELNALALRGARQNVDLMVTDLFEDAADVGAIIAASFGKLARLATEDPEGFTPPNKEDLAAAALGIVSDNIGLIATAHARGADVSRIVYGGSTLLVHPQIADVMRGFGLIMGHETVILPQGGHTGSLGALLLAERSA